MAKMFGKLELPAGFAEDILQCEIEMELSEPVKPEIVMRLIQLYAVGLEYYESMRSYKYLYFQKKMNQLVKSPKIVDEVNQEQRRKQDKLPKQQPAKQPIPPDHRQQERIRVLEIKRQHEQLQHKIVETLYHTGDRLKNMLNQTEIQHQNTVERINQQINGQEQMLRVKLQQRKGRQESRKSFCEVEQGEAKSTRDSLFNESEEFDQRDAIPVSFKSLIDDDEV